MSEGQGAEGAPNGAAAAASPWASLSEENRGWAEMKRFDGLDSLVQSARLTEKMRGVPVERLATIPANENDAEGWAALYGKLGRPEKVEDYGIEGVSPELIAVAHQNGLSKRQVTALAKSIQDLAGKSKTEADAKWEADSSAADEALKREWGGEFQANIQAAQKLADRVRTGLGLDQEKWNEVADKMQRAIGVEMAVKMFALLGRGLGEHPFIEGESHRDGFGMTPARAKAELAQLRADPDHQKRKMSDNKATRMEAVAREMKLDELAFPQSA